MLKLIKFHVSHQENLISRDSLSIAFSIIIIMSNFIINNKVIRRRENLSYFLTVPIATISKYLNLAREYTHNIQFIP